MRYQTYIRELVILSPILDIEHVQLWLIKYEQEFKSAISYSSCRKWSKWMNNKEKPYPCVCNTRVQDCIFIEAYYKFNNAFDLYKQQQHFMNLVPQYELIKKNKEGLKSFNEDLNALGLHFPFDSKIIISLHTKPYSKITLQLNEKEFMGILEFQKLFINIIN